MDQLYAHNPGTADVAPTQGAQASQASGYLAQAKDAAAKSYDAQTQDVNADALASNRLNTITSQDSPLMQRAKQEGMLLAAKRGLQNSSIAAGTAQGAMVDRAMPLAQQESAQMYDQSRANQEAINKARGDNTQWANETEQLNAQLGTSTSQQNAALQTDVSKFNAGTATDVSRFNAETQARAAEQNAAATNAMRQKIVEENAALNRQFLSGEQTLTLADIQGKYQQLISSNAAAAQLYDSYFQGISAAMANHELAPERVAQLVQQQQRMLDSGLSLIQNMGTLTFGGGSPGGTGAPGGTSGTGAPQVGIAPPTSIPSAVDPNTLNIRTSEQLGGGMPSRGSGGNRQTY